jgi:DNA polymerase III delta prime subunit
MNITEKLKSLNLKEEDIQEITKTVEEDKNKAIDSKEIALKSKYEKEIVALKSETAAPAQSSQPASPAQSVESDLTKQLLGKFDTLVSSINSVQQENQILRTEMEIKEVFGNHLDPSKKEYVK